MPPRLLSLVVAAVMSTAVAVAVAPTVEAAGVVDGPDVSSYQHPNGAAIKWGAVHRSGREFAIVKATEGTGYVNPWFARDYTGVRTYGMVRGSYHFARPGYPLASTALAQAKAYVARIGSSRTAKTLPPALDLETTGGLGQADLVTWAQLFLLDLRSLTGRTPMLYTYPWFWTHTLGDPSALSRYPLWMATYSGAVTPAASLWQYTASARVSGIPGGVDMSRLTTTGAAWTALSDGRPATPWPATAPGAPQSVSVAAADGQAKLRWLPGDTGSLAVTSYRVVASPGGATAVVSGTASSATVGGLVNGTAYTFTVTAVNAVGSGTPSAPTAPVVPMVSTRLVTSATPAVVPGAVATVTGRLTRGAGTPVAGVQVRLATRPHGLGDWTAVTTLVTDATGSVSTPLAPSVPTDVRLRYVGPTGWRTAAGYGTVDVRPDVTARLSASTVRVGHPVTLSGATTPSYAGVLVRRQAYYSGAWHTWQTALTGADGTFAFTITPKEPAHLVYRALVSATQGMSASASATLRLTVIR